MVNSDVGVSELINPRPPVIMCNITYQLESTTALRRSRSRSQRKCSNAPSTRILSIRYQSLSPRLVKNNNNNRTGHPGEWGTFKTRIKSGRYWPS